MGAAVAQAVGAAASRFPLAGAACLEAAGVNALPIIALLSLHQWACHRLSGWSAAQSYGANIFIVELVSLTMLRELAPLITAIIVAGRLVRPTP